MGKKKKKSQKKKRSKKSSKSEDALAGYRGSEDEMDLGKDLYPIGYYINDRAEMINQMFAVTKPERIRSMLPPILKDSSTEELKAYCLEELLGMSSKRILSILDGQELESSSESDDNESSVESASLVDKTRRLSADMKEVDSDDDKHREVPPDDTDTLEIGITREEMGELLDCMPSNKENDRKRRLSGDKESVTSSSKRNKSKVKSQENINTKKTVKKNSESENSRDVVKGDNKEDDATAAEDIDESKGKTLLEILELEMRARAIRALLKQQVPDGEEEGENSNATESTQANKSPQLQKESEDSDCLESLKPSRKKPKIKESNTSSVNDEVKNPQDIETKNDCGNSSETKIKLKDEQRVPDLETYKEKESEMDTSKTKKMDVKESTKESTQEDGEKNSSGDSVIEIQAEGPPYDVIVLDDSEDEVSELQKGDSSQKNEEMQEVSCEDSNKVSEGKISEVPNPEIDANDAKEAEESWAGRWLQSEGVQKVVSTSKICARIRKRMKLNRK